MTRITIEVNEAGVVTTEAPSSPAASTSTSSAAADPLAGAINAGSAPDLTNVSGPMPYIPSSSAMPEIPPGAISAGPAPDSVFQSPGGSV